jgi:predicted  nucleic acid-binding Zn-ribbon protein
MKKHTEKLEEEKKGWIEKIYQMQDDCASMRLKYDALVAEKENSHHESIEMHHMINQLHFDKEELVRNHTLETSELRKKVSVLTKRLKAATSNDMAVALSSTFTDFASEMDSLNMDNSYWDNYTFVNDFASITPHQEQIPPKLHEYSWTTLPA